MKITSLEKIRQRSGEIIPPTQGILGSYLGKNMVEDPSESFTLNGVQHICIVSKSLSAECPECGQTSTKTHGYSERNPVWAPIGRVPVVAHAKIRRFICENCKCGRKTFIEQTEHLLPYRHFDTRTLATALSICLFCGAKGAEKICHGMGIDISHDTIRRLLLSIEVVDDPDIKIIGVDDVANRKGQSYLTVIYDGNDHHLLSILDGRDKEPLKEWLSRHKKVSVVCRDRGSAYAEAVTEAVKDCVQVADRFHLFQNLIDRFQKIFKDEGIPGCFYIKDEVLLDGKPKKEDPSERIEELDYDKTAPVDEDGSEIEVEGRRLNPTGKLVEEQKQRRLEKQAEAIRVRSVKKQDPDASIQSISEKTDVSKYLVGKYLSMTEEEINKLSDIHRHLNKRKTPADEYNNIIYKMLTDGHYGSTIVSYIAVFRYNLDMSEK